MTTSSALLAAQSALIAAHEKALVAEYALLLAGGTIGERSRFALSGRPAPIGPEVEAALVRYEAAFAEYRAAGEAYKAADDAHFDSLPTWVKDDMAG